MAMRPHPKSARTDSSSPRAWGTCVRCGFVHNLESMMWQHDWRGVRLQNLNLLVCSECLDEPQRQLGTIILPPDPVGILNARPEPYPIDEYANIIFEERTLNYDNPIYAEQSNGQQAIVLEFSTYFDTD